MKAEDIAKLDDTEIGRHFAGSYGPKRFKEAIALLRDLANGRNPPKPAPTLRLTGRQT